MSRANGLAWTSLPTLAADLGVALATVKQWRQEGMPGADRRYPVRDVIAWCASQGKFEGGPRGHVGGRTAVGGDGAAVDEAAPRASRAALLSEQVAKTRADRQLKELELAKEWKRVIAADAVRAAFGVFVAAVKRARDAYARGALGPDELDRAIDAIEAEIRTCTNAVVTPHGHAEAASEGKPARAGRRSAG